jgi:hypothetical protein
MQTSFLPSGRFLLQGKSVAAKLWIDINYPSSSSATRSTLALEKLTVVTPTPKSPSRLHVDVVSVNIPLLIGL